VSRDYEPNGGSRHDTKERAPPDGALSRTVPAKERTISIEEQRRIISRWAKANDAELATEIVEQNVSGSKPWRERGLGTAMQDVEEGRGDDPDLASYLRIEERERGGLLN
jgi:hypothetical protein